ncbi:type I restriction endonuclease [Enterobacter asburiae]|nr:type I restriction endonuclease [Enterobacter asburiae]
MENFKNRISLHADHVKNMGAFCTTEETTKQALIMPFLDVLGFTPYDPTKVKAEYYADFPGVKANERVDYALFCNDAPVMFIEAKSFSEKLDNHCPQLSRYFNSTPEVTVSAITNGVEWRFFTDLKQKNIMDPTPFLKVRMDKITDSDIRQLYRFRYDTFKPETLRTLAEESVFLSEFTRVISISLRDADQDFVRYVASRSNIERQLNQRFLDSITPIVKQAVERSVSAMVVQGLSNSDAINNNSLENQGPKEDENGPIINPENQNIVTTKKELDLFNIVKKIAGENFDIQYKDTESYFGILLDGKTNRWICRFHDKSSSYITFPVELNDAQSNEIKRARLEFNNQKLTIDSPDDVMRISGIIMDMIDYVSNDENFRRKQQLTEA